jgi:hypothetical protein
MKVTNADAPGAKAVRSTRGMVSTNAAGSKGMVWRDGATESVGQIRDMTVLGMTFTDNEDGTGVLTAGSDPGVPGTGGTVAVPVEHGNMGATETIDLAVGTVHRGTLNANCAITITGFAAGLFAEPLLFEVAQNGVGSFAITWDADVEWYGNDEPDQGATDVTHYVFFGMDGDGTIYGFRAGGGVTADDIKDIGHWEVVVSGTAPPVAVSTPGDDDWVYAWVPG